MKKLFTLIALMLFVAVGAQAQGKKEWNFSKGWSEETIADLKADTKNWTIEYNDDGSIKAIKEATKLTGDFIANGNYIKELVGLTRGTAGLSKNNNYLLTTKTFRLNRNNQEIIFPKLANGQTITIVGKSANSTAENRGIKAAYDYMKQIEGPEDNLVRASLGEVTQKWIIETDSPDSVDVKFTMITGGVDFTLFMIDEGDVLPTAKIAYLYDGTEDAAYSYLSQREETVLTPVNVSEATPTAEELQQYDVVVVSGTVPADNAVVSTLKEAMPWVPTLNLNGALYTPWGYGEPVMSAVNIAVINNLKHDLFEGFQEDQDYFMVDGMSVLQFGDDAFYEVKLGDYFAGDAVPVVDGNDPTVAAIHLHNINHNGYIYMPYAPTYTDGALKVLEHALTLLHQSKSAITPATAPSVSLEYKDMATIVTLTAPKLPKAKIYYTTDGSDPTTSSTEYTEPFTVYNVCTVKASAIAEGYTLSAPAEMFVDIKSQPATPQISSVEEEGKTTVTLSGNYGDDVKIWYNFVGSTDTLQSTVYTEPFVITMPQDVTAYAVAGGAVWSETAEQRVLVRNPRVVIDVAGHFTAPQWTGDNNPDGLTVNNGKGMFSWGASAVSQYVGEGTPGEDPETGDEIIIYGPEDLREQECVNEPGDNPQWVLKSRGTCLIWQNTTAQTTNFGQDSNYNPIASTDVDQLFPVTKNDIQFYKFAADETPNGSIESINKYQAPLDVVVLANMAGGPLLAQVSADGETWTTIGQMEKTGFSRMWGKGTMSYNGTDEVYVRVTMETASAGVKVFDIYVANQGPESQALLDKLNEEYGQGVAVIRTSSSLPAGIYTINGTRVSSLQRGLNIIVGRDGSVRKMVKE